MSKSKTSTSGAISPAGSTKNEDSIKFYSLSRILSKKCQYNLIVGERSNGKTYATLEYAIRQWITSGHQCAYVRRYREDFRGKRGDTLFANHIQNGLVSQLTNNEFDTILHRAGRWYLAKYDPALNKAVPEDDPFCYGFSLSETEHDKSSSYPNVTTIIFDEFLTRQYYLPNEFVLFMNCISTIIRHRDNVTIFMLGNTVNKYCPYFREMGLSHVADMEQGKIDIYTYGQSSLRVAVERCAPSAKKGKKSDLYFAFNNPELQMITGGAWEIALYPHLPLKYKPSDILFIYFINFDDNLLQCEIIQIEDSIFTYIHRKSTPIQDEENDIIFSEQYSPRPNHFRNIRKPHSQLTKRISTFFVEERVFYQDNEVGEIIRNYLQFCKTDSLRN